MDDNHELDYEFDLRFDVKTYGEAKYKLNILRQLYVNSLREYEELVFLCQEHGLDI